MSAQTPQTAQTPHTTTSVDQGLPQLLPVAGPSAQAAMGIPHDKVTELLGVLAAGRDPVVIQAMEWGIPANEAVQLAQDPTVMDALATGIPVTKALKFALEPPQSGGGPPRW